MTQYDPFLTLQIRNYQSLKDLTVALGSITVFLGHSDAGKSAILRAIEQAVFNDASNHCLTINPDGSKATETTVSLTTASNQVTWRRTQTTASYLLGESVYEKMGRSTLPSDIQDFLGFREISPDPQSPPFRSQCASQFEPPFLVADRGGVPSARLLSRLIGLHVISGAQKVGYAGRTGILQQHNLLVEQRDKLRNELSQYENLEEDKAKLDELATQWMEIGRKFQKVRQICERMTALTLLRQDAEMCQSALKVAAVHQGTVAHLRGSLRLGALVKSLCDMRQTRPVNVDVPVMPSIRHIHLMNEWMDKSYRVAQQVEKTRDLVREEVSRYEEAEKEFTEFSASFPLCPFVPQFKEQSGAFRCKDLMVSLTRSLNAA